MRTTILKERLQSAFIATLFITVFLPFGLNHFGWMRWVYLVGIGLTIAFSVLSSEFLVENVFKIPNDVSKGSKYIIRRNMLFETLNLVFSCPLMMLFLDRFVCSDAVDNHFGWASFAAVFAVNCWTTVVIHFYWRNVYKRHYLIKQLEEAQLLNGVLQERQRKEFSPNTLPQQEPATDSDDPICISGTTKESLDVRPSQVVYATSEGNYVHIYYYKDDKPHNMLIRTSMKNVSELLCRQSSIMQCHRAYIVNLLHVAKVESRNSGIALVMKDIDETVLVSKQYSTEVKEKIKNPSTIS